MRILGNNTAEFGEPISARHATFLDRAAATAALELMEACFGGEPTPLLCLPALGRQLGIGELFVKDESRRLGLGSFKPMGGAYAVLRILQAKAERSFGRAVLAHDLGDPEVRALARELTVCCATDGNHGRAVASGARLVGCRAVVFLHEGVSELREQAIRELGAETRRVPGSYDDSVEQAARAAAAQGWTMVTDTSWDGNLEIPAIVMQGYAGIAAEVDREVDRPTHIFLQAGVGGFAASIAGYFAIRYGVRRPIIIIVEPERARCLYSSNQRQSLTATVPAAATVMAMLDCHVPSLIAWDILARTAHYFMTLEENDAVAAMRQFATPVGDDPAVVSGESGCAGLAALMAASTAANRARLALSERSRVLIFNTEGATDHKLYESLVGRTATQVEEMNFPDGHTVPSAN